MNLWDTKTVTVTVVFSLNVFIIILLLCHDNFVTVKAQMSAFYTYHSVFTFQKIALDQKLFQSWFQDGCLKKVIIYSLTTASS